MTVLRQRMAQVRQLGLLAPPLTVQLRFGVCAALMRLIRPLLAVKIHVRITRLETIGVCRIVGLLLLELKTLRGGESFSINAPSTEKCSLHNPAVNASCTTASNLRKKGMRKV
jgi:hypothetical protein